MGSIGKETLRLFLHDSLPEVESAEVERALRSDAALRELLDAVRDEEDRGEHSVGAVWRRFHVSCPSRDQLGGYLLGALDDDVLDYIRFHLDVVGCAFCSANRDDLQKKQSEASEKSRQRRKRIVESSAGLLRERAKPV